jgi:hypothetical protein
LAGGYRLAVAAGIDGTARTFLGKAATCGERGGGEDQRQARDADGSFAQRRHGFGLMASSTRQFSATIGLLATGMIRYPYPGGSSKDPNAEIPP